MVPDLVRLFLIPPTPALLQHTVKPPCPKFDGPCASSHLLRTHEGTVPRCLWVSCGLERPVDGEGGSIEPPNTVEGGGGGSVDRGHLFR